MTIQGMTFEQMAEVLSAQSGLTVTVGGEVLRQSTTNPAAALAAWIGFDAAMAAEASGLPEDVFGAEDVVCRVDTLERGLGRLAAALLCKMRGDMRRQAWGVEMDFERPLGTAMALGVMVANTRAMAKAKSLET